MKASQSTCKPAFREAYGRCLPALMVRGRALLVRLGPGKSKKTIKEHCKALRPLQLVLAKASGAREVGGWNGKEG